MQTPGRRPVELRVFPYAQARAWIDDGDLGLCVSDKAIAVLIERATQSDYSHAFLCGWDREVLMLGESIDPESRLVSISSRVHKIPSNLDIYRLRPEIAANVDLVGAWQWMHRASGIKYPIAELLHDWRVIATGDHDPGRWVNSDIPGFRRVCSTLVHAALPRVHGMPPIKPLDHDVYPGTLADPNWFSYLFTLTV